MHIYTAYQQQLKATQTLSNADRQTWRYRNKHSMLRIAKWDGHASLSGKKSYLCTAFEHIRSTDTELPTNAWTECIISHTVESCSSKKYYTVQLNKHHRYKQYTRRAKNWTVVLLSRLQRRWPSLLERSTRLPEVTGSIIRLFQTSAQDIFVLCILGRIVLL